MGSIFNASELAGEVRVDSKTIASWLSVLHASYIIYLLPPNYENISMHLVKSSKLYFCTPGLACYLLDIKAPRQFYRDARLHLRAVCRDGGRKAQDECWERRRRILLPGFHQKRIERACQGRESNNSSGNQILTDLLEFRRGHIGKSLAWINTQVRKRAVVYAGDFENTTGKIGIINYKHLEIYNYK